MCSATSTGLCKVVNNTPAMPVISPASAASPGQKRDQLDLADAFAQVMLSGRDGVPPAVARQPAHRVLALERGDHVAPGRVLAGEKDPDLHDASKAGQVASSAKLVDDPSAGGKERPHLFVIPANAGIQGGRARSLALGPPPSRG